MRKDKGSMNWDECCKRYLAKRVHSDVDLVNSLIEASNDKNHVEKKIPLSNISTGAKISLAYDVLRELLEALSLLYLFKIKNHQCYTPFLREVLKESEVAKEFDEIRKIRNEINYYGRRPNVEEASAVLAIITSLRVFILEKIREKGSPQPTPK